MKESDKILAIFDCTLQDWIESFVVFTIWQIVSHFSHMSESDVKKPFPANNDTANFIVDDGQVIMWPIT